MADLTTSPPDPRVPAWVTALTERERVLRSALDSDHLQAGLWTRDRPGLPLEAAQLELLARLKTFLQQPPADLVVFGWGLGAPVGWFAGQGYSVVGRDGSPQRVTYARQRYGGGGAAFETTRDVSATVGAALILEPPPEAGGAEALIRRAAASLSASGRLVMSLRTRQGGSTTTDLPTDRELSRALAESGFVVLEHLDLSHESAQTVVRLLQRLESRRRQVERLLGDGGARVVDEVLGDWRSRADAVNAGLERYSIWVCRRDEIVLRGYREGDEHRILPLFEGVFYHPRTLEHWQWKYRDNPVGALRIAVAIAPDGDLAAHYAAYPVRFASAVPCLPGCESAQVGDTMTHPRYRRKGLGRTGLLARLAQYYYNRFRSDDVPFLFGFNTGHIRTLGERYLDYEYLPTVSVASAAVDALRRSPVRRVLDRLVGWRVTSLDAVDASFDVLLDEVLPEYGFLVRRDATWLRWRYLDCPDRWHELFAVHLRGRLVGWSVFRRDGSTLRWGDGLFRRDPADATSILLDHVVRCADPAVDRVAGWLAPHPGWWVERLRALGFSVDTEPRDLAPGFRIFDPAYGVETLGRYLYYTEGDSDLL